MSEVAASDPVPSSSGGAASEECPAAAATSEAVPASEAVPTSDAVPEGEAEPPAAKKPRLEREPERLEQRLGGILCCAVCLDLPPAAVYQCTNGHLMCAACFTHVLADARLRDEAATCPNCRQDISKTSACRNLAVEKTVSELPLECKYCARVFPRHALTHHEQQTCDERQFTFSQIVVGGESVGALSRLVTGLQRVGRWLLGPLLPQDTRKRPYAAAASTPRLTECEYACLGCPWRGPWHERGAHGAACKAPTRTALDALVTLREREEKAKQHQQVYTHLLDLLSYEKITFNDMQLKPYRTEEFIHKLYYETSRFAAFGHQWVVKANVNRHQRDPTQSIQREITYQVILKSKVGVVSGVSTNTTTLSVQWICVRGPWGEAALSPAVGSHQFADDTAESPPQPLPIAQPQDANRLLANKAIHFRLIMFLSSK